MSHMIAYIIESMKTLLKVLLHFPKRQENFSIARESVALFSLIIFSYFIFSFIQIS